MPAANDTSERTIGDHPAEERGLVAVPDEELLGAQDVRVADREVAPPALEERPAAVVADRVGDERADGGADRAGEHGERQVPGPVGQGLHAGALADEEAGEREHELGRDRNDDALDRDPDRDAEVADRLVQGRDRLADGTVEEVEHARQDSRGLPDEARTRWSCPALHSGDGRGAHRGRHRCRLVRARPAVRGPGLRPPELRLLGGRGPRIEGRARRGPKPPAPPPPPRAPSLGGQPVRAGRSLARVQSVPRRRSRTAGPPTTRSCRPRRGRRVPRSGPMPRPSSRC